MRISVLALAALLLAPGAVLADPPDSDAPAHAQEQQPSVPGLSPDGEPSAGTPDADPPPMDAAAPPTENAEAQTPAATQECRTARRRTESRLSPRRERAQTCAPTRTVAPDEAPQSNPEG